MTQQSQPIGSVSTEGPDRRARRIGPPLIVVLTCLALVGGLLARSGDDEAVVTTGTTVAWDRENPCEPVDGEVSGPPRSEDSALSSEDELERRDAVSDMWDDIVEDQSSPSPEEIDEATRRTAEYERLYADKIEACRQERIAYLRDLGMVDAEGNSVGGQTDRTPENPLGTLPDADTESLPTTTTTAAVDALPVPATSGDGSVDPTATLPMGEELVDPQLPE